MLTLFTHNSTTASVKSKRYGFTLLELLVAGAMGLIVIAGAFSVTMGSRQTYDFDRSRTALNQNLRAAMEIIGSDIRQAGESLPGDFPAVQLTSGTGSTGDTLTIRRNLFDRVVSICATITAGTNNPIDLSCSSTKSDDVTGWATKRTAAGNTIRAYLFNPTTKSLEPFDYTGENTSTFKLTRSGNWEKTYTYDPANPSNAARLYLLEEHVYSLNTNKELQRIQEAGTAQRLVPGISDFQISIAVNITTGGGGSTATTKTDFAATEDWQDITGINIALTAAGTANGKTISRTLQDQFLPRNAQSKIDN
jgi:Tfp pilus assembly protein PilW